MIAGFAYDLQRHMPPEQALAFATAVAAANAMEESTGFVRLDNVLRLATMVVPNRII